MYIGKFPGRDTNLHNTTTIVQISHVTLTPWRAYDQIINCAGNDNVPSNEMQSLIIPKSLRIRIEVHSPVMMMEDAKSNIMGHINKLRIAKNNTKTILC